MKKSALLVACAVSMVGTLGGLVACTADDTDSPGGATPDGGIDAGDSGADSTPSPAEDAAPNEAGPEKPGSFKMFLANGVTSIEDRLRFCLLSSAATDEPGLDDVVDAPALPETAQGLGPGELTTVTVNGTLKDRSLRLAMFHAAALDSFGLSDKSCKEIVANIHTDGGTGSLIDGVDFEVGVSALPRTVFREDRRFFVLATGCPRSTTPDYADGECPGGAGGAWDGTKSYFRGLAYELDPTPTATAGKNRVQHIFASEAGRQFLKEKGLEEVILQGIAYPDGDDVRTEWLTGLDADAGAQPFIETSGPLLPAPGTEVTDLRTMSGVNFRFLIPGSAPGFRPVEEVDLLSGGFKVADVQPGKAYTLVNLGTPLADPKLPDNSPNPAYMHFVLVPNE